VTAGDVFSEDWRSLVCARIGSQDPFHDTASLYGTADGGVLACESPLSIAIRRFLVAHPPALYTLTGGFRLPTLCQYNPMTRWFECQDGELLFSADGGIPLVRYAILDRGGICTYDHLLALCAAHGGDPIAGLPADTRLRRLPFVWVFGRTHIAISLDGANIYPEHIAGALDIPPLCEHLSGKFVMRLVEDAQHDPRLQCILELASGTVASDAIASAAATTLRAHLDVVNSEYAHYVPSARRTPVILLRPHRDSEWFPPGTKHRYVR
jgi:phenylacetate-CoA ligase